MYKVPNIDFIGKSRVYFTISSALIIIAILASFIFGVKLDIQFKGGTIISYSHTGKIKANDVEAFIKKTIGEEVSAREAKDSSGKSNMVISFAKDKGISIDKQNKVTQELQKKFKDNKIELVQTNNVDPTMGHEFLLKALLSVAFASVVLILFIALRFKKIGGWSAGIMAVVALVHDVLMVYATFVFFRMPLNDSFMAIVLVILGYSINDTIIIYDRIRENKRIQSKSMPIGELVNLSINQSFTRSVNTSVATIMAMVVLVVVAIVFNLTSIVTFALPLVVGMISGVYSTICIATQLWVIWKQRQKA